MKARQKVFYDKYRSEFEMHAIKYRPYFDDFSTVYNEALKHHDDPHQKRELRIGAWKEIQENGTYSHVGWLDRDGRIVFKMKTDEIAKPNGAPRGIGDFGVQASLAGFVLTGMLKEAQAKEPIVEERHGKLCRAEFLKSPARKDLEVGFNRMWSGTEDIFLMYFSDDSVLQYTWRGRKYYANLDISKCDASHGPGIFQAYESLYPQHCQPATKILMDQCMAACVMRSVDRRFGKNRKLKVVMTPKTPVLYSGSTITTSLNNTACMTIYLAIRDCDTSSANTIDEVGVKLEAAIEECGYQVTGLKGEWCEIFEDVQFLKHSPVQDIHGNWRAVKNLGVLGRSSGVCRGDLPGRGDWKLRAALFQLVLLVGMYPRDSFLMLDNMKKTAARNAMQKPSERVAKLISKKVAFDQRYKVAAAEEEEMCYFHSGDIYRRYRLTGAEEESLLAFSLSQAGDVTSGPAWDKILRKDYGLGAQ
jgi:hypothetical protein